jgi:hypothetical protein
MIFGRMNVKLFKRKHKITVREYSTCAIIAGTKF